MKPAAPKKTTAKERAAQQAAKQLPPVKRGTPALPKAPRLNKVLAQSGQYSRREADELIAAGKVFLNGTPVTLAGLRLPHPAEAQKLVVNGKPYAIAPPPPKTIVLYKPKGLSTTRKDETGRSTVYEALPPDLQKLKPVGRLDRNSHGLLLLTNDGDLHHRLTHPSFHLAKVYEVRVNKPITGVQALAETLIAGVFFEEEDTLAKVVEVALLDKHTLQLTLHSGLNRQIRRMLEHCGYRVSSLKRLSLGPCTLKGLKPSQWRALTAGELTQLRNTVGLGGLAQKPLLSPAEAEALRKKAPSAAAPSAFLDKRKLKPARLQSIKAVPRQKLKP
jgi:23S rRNA pseudouridine2605 synthase